MKTSYLAIPILALWGTVSIAADADAPQAVAPENENDEAVYSLGYELGTELKRHDLDFSEELLLQGIRDAVDGNKPLVKTTSRNKALAQLREQRAQDALEQSRAFLAENGKKEDVVTLESGLQYRVIQSGEGNSPQADSNITVKYRGTLIDGTEFANSEAGGKPATHSMKKVIKGWREALPQMKEGDKWTLYIPPELAYGKRGLSGRIPPNSMLIYEVELIAVN